jgi:hypothetical protein
MARSKGRRVLYPLKVPAFDIEKGMRNLGKKMNYKMIVSCFLARNPQCNAIQEEQMITSSTSAA